jgi:hypothetical protein
MPCGGKVVCLGNTQLSYGYDLLAFDLWLKVRAAALAGSRLDDLLGFMADRKQLQSI